MPLKGKALAEFQRYQVVQAGFVPVEYDGVDGRWHITEKVEFWKARCPKCSQRFGYTRIGFMMVHLEEQHGMAPDAVRDLFQITVGGK